MKLLSVVASLCTALVWLLLPPAAHGARPAPPPQQQVSLPYAMPDSVGTQWDVGGDGSINDGGNDLYDGGGHLFLNNSAQYTSPVAQVAFDPVNNELLMPAVPLMGLNVSRRVAVNREKGWCRWVEVLENPTGQAVRVQVRVNFNLGGGVQGNQPLNDDKGAGASGQTIAVGVFDGDDSLGMVGAGRGAKVVPNFSIQPGSDNVDIVYDLEVPARKTAAVVHFQVHRRDLNDAMTVMSETREREYLAGLPREVMSAIVNFRRTGADLPGLDGVEVLRGELMDVVELRGGDLYKGTVLETAYELETFFGTLTLPAEKVVAINTVGESRPVHLLVTSEGEVFGGVLRLKNDTLHVELSSGHATKVPLRSIRRMGYRRRPNEPAEWQFTKPLVLLRGGQRVFVRAAAPVPVATRYGLLQVDPKTLSYVSFDAEGQVVHEVALVDGSRFAGVVAAESFELELAGAPASAAAASAGTAATTSAAGKARKVKIPASAILRLQLASGDPAQDSTAGGEPSGTDIDEPPTLTLSNDDLLIGTVGGKLVLETGFDAIEINAAEVRGIGPGEETPGEVRLTMWDGATLSGRLRDDVLSVKLACGAAVRVPASMVREYVQPQPQPPAKMVERIKAVAAELNDEDWRVRDRAAGQLVEIGPAAAGVLRGLRGGMSPEGQKQIDEILGAYREASRRASQPPVPLPVKEDIGLEAVPALPE